MVQDTGGVLSLVQEENTSLSQLSSSPVPTPPTKPQTKTNTQPTNTHTQTHNQLINQASK